MSSMNSSKNIKKSKNMNNKKLHEIVLELLFSDIITTEQANKLHQKIDKMIKD